MFCCFCFCYKNSSENEKDALTKLPCTLSYASEGYLKCFNVSADCGQNVQLPEILNNGAIHQPLISDDVCTDDLKIWHKSGKIENTMSSPSNADSTSRSFSSHFVYSDVGHDSAIGDKIDSTLNITLSTSASVYSGEDDYKIEESSQINQQDCSHYLTCLESPNFSVSSNVDQDSTIGDRVDSMLNITSETTSTFVHSGEDETDEPSQINQPDHSRYLTCLESPSFSQCGTTSKENMLVSILEKSNKLETTRDASINLIGSLHSVCNDGLHICIDKFEGCDNSQTILCQSSGNCLCFDQQPDMVSSTLVVGDSTYFEDVPKFSDSCVLCIEVSEGLNSTSKFCTSAYAVNSEEENGIKSASMIHPAFNRNETSALIFDEYVSKLIGVSKTTANSNLQDNKNHKLLSSSFCSLITCNSSFYDDSVFTFATPMLQKSTSLKSSKTPPGTPRCKKVVRFADAMGLDLESVRHILNLESPPKISVSVMGDLQVNKIETQISGNKYIVEEFSQPGGWSNFKERVISQKVLLENAVAVSGSITGVIRVSNIGFHKVVRVRFTTDDWTSWTDRMASYVLNSNDGPTDRFSFTVVTQPDFVPGCKLEFAISFSCDGVEYWDNNYCQNYVFKCMAKTFQTESENTLLHFF